MIEIVFEATIYHFMFIPYLCPFSFFFCEYDILFCHWWTFRLFLFPILMSNSFISIAAEIISSKSHTQSFHMGIQKWTSCHMWYCFWFEETPYCLPKNYLDISTFLPNMESYFSHLSPESFPFCFAAVWVKSLVFVSEQSPPHQQVWVLIFWWF